MILLAPLLFARHVPTDRADRAMRVTNLNTLNFVGADAVADDMAS